MLGSKYWKSETTLRDRAKIFMSILTLALLFIDQIKKFFTKMISKESSTKLNRQNKFRESHVFVIDYPWKWPIISLKFSNFP